MYTNDSESDLFKEILISGTQMSVRQNHDSLIASKSFANVAKFKYLGTTATNQNSIKEEIKSKLNSGNACYHSIQSFVFLPPL
jgi:hypothetical protein